MKALSVALSVLLCVQAVIPSVNAQTPPARLQIVVVDGEGAINNVGQRSSHDPVVRVTDDNDKPVTGASVVFSLPTEGPSGSFGNGEKTLIMTTSPQGQATATGLKVNLAPGKLQIHVNASYRGQTARTNITQFNMSVPGKRAGGGSSKTILVLLAIAGAAAGGVVAATGGKGNAAAPATPAAPPVTPIGITPGPGTVGPPR
jgi:hypothetical protein